MSEIPPATSLRSPARRLLRRLVVVLLVVIGVIVFDGARREPTRAAEGTRLQGAAAHAPRNGPFRVATFNIDGGMGVDGQRDLSRAAALFRDCDLVGVNEVHGASLFGSQDQAEILGKTAGLPWLFAPVERQWWREAFGNAVLTSLHVAHWQRLPLSASTASSNRNVLLLKVDFGSPGKAQLVNVLISHVERGHDHDSQLRAVLTLYLSLAEPAILLGDLNAIDDEPQIKQILASPGVVDAIGRTIPGVAKHVDWLLLRGLSAVAGGSQPKGVSDHPFFWADVAVDPQLKK